MGDYPIVGGRLEMKDFLSRISKRNRIIIGAVAVILIVVVLVARGRGNANSSTSFQTQAAQRGELTATVGATGSVRATQSATLNWQNSGIVQFQKGTPISITASCNFAGAQGLSLIHI